MPEKRIPDDKLLKLYYSGVTPKSIGERYGVSYKYVISLLNSTVPEKKEAKAKRQEAFIRRPTLEQVEALRAEGFSCSHIGYKFGVTKNAIIGMIHYPNRKVKNGCGRKNTTVSKEPSLPQRLDR